MGNATPPVERLREESHDGFRWKHSKLQALHRKGYAICGSCVKQRGDVLADENCLQLSVS